MSGSAAVQPQHVERPTCWCCGNSFEEQDLTRLGSHPEVGVCAACARWLHRRARSRADTGTRSVGAIVRRATNAGRERVRRAGLQDRPILGPLLRRLDRHLP